MEALNQSLDQLGSAGFVLSTEHRAALSSSLVVLQNNEKFESVKFWGTIVGTTGNYYVAQGFGKSQLTDVKNFYTHDCISWAQLPEVHPVIAASAQRIRTRFTGSASNEFVVSEPGPSADEAPVDLPDDVKAMRSTEEKEDGTTITTTISEERRVAAAIQWIDSECSIVPFGAFIKTAGGEIKNAPNFSGLSTEDAGKLASYLHFRVPVNARSPLERAQQDKATDFLDLLTDDIPKGTWTVQHGSGGATVLVKSLAWPGFVFYHAPNTGKYGCIYTGIGQRNSDLAFMMPN
jgi:radial spoke head protein 9